LAATPAAAHGDAHHIGDLTITVNWEVEPAVVGQTNAVLVSVMHHDHANGTDEPVEGAEGLLTLEIHFAMNETDLSLRAIHGEPGWYRAAFIPTVLAEATGDYLVHLMGTIEGTEVMIEHDLHGTHAASEVEFPPSDNPTPEQVAAQVDALEAQVTALESQNSQLTTRLTAAETANGQVQTELADANAQASSGYMFGLIGILAGLAGAALGAVAILRGRPAAAEAPK
jgi:hypothetical protein